MAVYQEKFSKKNYPPGYYVYLYLRADGTPYYIGKGKEKRAWQKRNGEVKMPSDTNRIIVICWDISDVWAFILERKLIQWFGRKDIGTGILRNKTPGGEGVSDGTNLKAAHEWAKNLSDQERKDHFDKQAEKRCKGWYVSRIEDPTNEVFVLNIAKWCRENQIDTSCPSQMQGPNAKLKSTKGWRIRRSDMPPLAPYVNNKNASRPNIACKGKGWRLVNGKREWYDKYQGSE